MASELAVEDRVIMAMKQLGFTASDARTYLFLLKSHPATGYELAASSGVPRSAIYTVLNRLESRGLVSAIQRKPARYVPLSPDRLFELIESRFLRNLEDLKTSLNGLAKHPPGIQTWTIQGYNEMMERARTMIAGCKKTVHLSLWNREAESLAESLSKAEKSGVEVVLFSFTDLSNQTGHVLSYGIQETELEPYWPHRLILVADRAQAMVGGAEDTEQNQALVSEEAALVEMAISNLVLDITLYGQRTGHDVQEVVSGLTEYLAPVEELVNGKLGGNHA
jgi:HTH-type transcriptional regulator, sugar sensing transcriptional regulator